MGLNTLYDAAIAGDADAIAKLDMEADRLNKYGQSILHVESVHGNTEHVRFILSEFANKNLLVKLTPDKRTPLHSAVYWGYTEVAEVLIDAARHLPPSAIDHNTHDNPVNSFQAFLRQGNEDMDTALHFAVSEGHVDIVKLLVDADPSDRHTQNNQGKTPIYIAVEKGYNEIVKVICRTCTAPSLDGPDGSTALNALLLNLDQGVVKLISQIYEDEIDIAHKGVTDLILAIRRRDRVSVIRLLEDNNRLVTFAAKDGWTPLHYAANYEFDSILAAIIEAQKDVGHQFVYKERVLTPFHVAARKGYTSTLILLMELWPASSSSAYTAINNDGQNILHLAALESKKEMIQGILRYCPQKLRGEILNKQDDNGNTTLHFLIERGCFIPEVIKYKGLDTMVKNKQDLTALDNFYMQDEIIADQVQIKIALDCIETDQYWKFWRKNITRKSNYLESVVLPSRREAKDVKFENAKKKLIDEKHGRMKKDLERYKKRTNTQIIVTALITTVTFTVGFTMPGGLHQSGEVDQGLAVLSKKTAFNAFMVSDALALLLSTCSLFLYFLESMYEDPRQVSKLNAASTGLNIVSVMAMMLTFITGTYVVLSHSLTLAITVCLIGSFFFLFVIVLLIKMVYDRQVGRNEE